MSWDESTRALLQRVPGKRLRAIYDRHDVAHDAGVDALLNEIRLDGANTIASMFRGWQGVKYDEVVADVAAQMKIDTDGRDPAAIEIAVLEKILQTYFDGATPDERERVEEILEKAGVDYSRWSTQMAKGVAAAGLLSLLIAQVGAQVTSRIVSQIVLQIITKQVAREAGKRAAQLAGWAIPVLNVVMIGWTVADLAGPAFRKTVPTVIEIALLRLEFGE